jgi:hypothetical protein
MLDKKKPQCYNVKYKPRKGYKAMGKIITIDATKEPDIAELVEVTRQLGSKELGNVMWSAQWALDIKHNTERAVRRQYGLGKEPPKGAA